jgi:acyl transferase domain-containing protein
MPAEGSKAALQHAIEELARQRSEIEALRSEKREPIAVVGMACRLPGAETPEEFWELLDRGTDSVSEVPRERWNIDAYYDADPSTVGKMATRCGGFIRNVDQFDPQFFGMAPREAQNMDPQQRVLLEVAWEALEHANIPPSSLYGTLTGVFVGITCFDHAIRMSRSTEGFNAYAGTGSALNMAPGRVSYVLGLTGPSMAIDTACSSSLVCLHVACQSLRQRESNVALVGGVHLILSPEVMVSFSQARMLSADGRSKTFDASADGYSRGEGCGVVVLKRVADALADGDTILGVIRGSAVNQDGPSGGLTVPNGMSQQQVIRRALDAAGVSPSAVTYVEAHGTGTSLGDPIEVEALAKAYGTGRAPDDSLLIGSVKTNIGHLEPAAGMAGLIKLLLAFEHGRIPRQLHFHTPNPHIPWHNVPVRVVSEPVPWPRSDRTRLAGLSAFGFSGTNAHVIVEEPPTSAASATFVRGTPQLLPLSAKSPEALKALASRYVALLTRERSVDLGALCHTASIGRTHFPHRLVALVATIDEATEALGAFVAGLPSPALRMGKASNAAYRRDGSEVQARLSRAYDALLRPDPSPVDRAKLLGEIADLHVEGMPIEWDRLCGPDRQGHVTLPTYPFQRQRYSTEPAEQLDDRVAESCSPSLYHIVWTSLGPPATSAVPAAHRRWVLVPGDRPLAEATRHQLRESGSEAQIAPAAEAADLTATDVVYLCGVQGPDGSTGACAELLTIVQASLARHDASPRIWVVTRGATPATGATSIAGVAHAPLAAFARVLSLEHPELFGRLVDLDPAAQQGDSGDAAELITEILQDTVEDHVALRGGERFAPRVEAVPNRVRPAAPVRADATYLITGGLGRLGLHAARWLAGRGARHLCLLGRTGVSTPEQRAAVSALEARGLRIRVATGDVADRVMMAALIRDLGEAPALRGIVHAAGLPGYAEIAELTHDDLASVLRPKTEGVWALHELTHDMPLDFFVGFSSIASAWGSRGQAHYAAANAFLDGLAHLRHASGLPAVTINWGPWADGGMTSPEAAALLARVGVRALASGDALASLDALAGGDEPQVVVADVDWGLFRGSYEARGHRRLLERLQAAAADAPAAVIESALVRSLKAATSTDREALLGAAVQTELAEVLALPTRSRPPLDQGLFEMGMDSLMALEFRTRLQTLVARALPATLVFDCPTIHAIVRFLLAELFAPPESGTKMRAEGEPIPAVAAESAADLEELSDDEAEALLLKKLEFIP